MKNNNVFTFKMSKKMHFFTRMSAKRYDVTIQGNQMGWKASDPAGREYSQSDVPWHFPGELFSSKMSVTGCLLVDRTFQVQLPVQKEKQFSQFSKKKIPVSSSFS
jgi:hypothetical protein